MIPIQHRWDGEHAGEVRLVDLRDVHWLQPDGAPQPLIHAFVLCTNIFANQIQHECEHASAPHRLRVCILRTSVPASAYDALARQADERRRRPHDRRVAARR